MKDQPSKSITGHFNMTVKDIKKSKVYWKFCRENALIAEHIALLAMSVLTIGVTYFNATSPMFMFINDSGYSERLLFPIRFVSLLLIWYLIFRSVFFSDDMTAEQLSSSEFIFWLDEDQFHYETILPHVTTITDLPTTQIRLVWDTKRHLVFVDDQDREFIVPKSAIGDEGVKAVRTLLQGLGKNYIIVKNLFFLNNL